MDAVSQRVTARVPARAGLVGNPSDGYGGRTLAVAVDNYAAEVELTPWDGLSITPAPADEPRWDSLDALVEEADRYGYHGAVPLIQAALVAFRRAMLAMDLDMPVTGFRLAYRTSIPRQVGLAGSSALVVATLKAVSEHTGVRLTSELLPSIALAAETRELGITAGLQDRVVQSHGGVVGMDFRSRKLRENHGYQYGDYQLLDPDGLPHLYLAHLPSGAGPSGAVHGALRDRFERGDWAVTSGMKMLANLAEQAVEAVRTGDHERLAALIDESFEARRRMVGAPSELVELVDVARRAGASATFAGSGGAIVGTYTSTDQLNDIQARLEPLGAITEKLLVAPEFAT